MPDNVSQALVFPTLPTVLDGHDVLTLPPTDTLAVAFSIEAIWVLPTAIDLDRFKFALARTLQLFPPVAGRLRKHPDTETTRGSLYIQLTNDGIPVSVMDDEETTDFPLETVVVDRFPKPEWIDACHVDADEPLLRIRFTNLKQTGETVYTISWSHALGDGTILHLFLSHILTFYRSGDVSQLPKPSFQKIYFPSPPTDKSTRTYFEGRMKHIRDAKPLHVLAEELANSHSRTSPVNLVFSQAELRALVDRVGPGDARSSHERPSRIDALKAYLVVKYNQVMYDLGRQEGEITTIVDTLDYRGNSLLAPTAMFGNAAITLTYPAVSSPKSLDASMPLFIESIRAGKRDSGDRSFLVPYVQFHSNLCDKCYQSQLHQYLLPATPHEMTFNSSHALNWHKAADFFERGSGYEDARRTRFHTTFMLERYVRIFRANAVRTTRSGHSSWDDSLEGGVEAAFRLPSDIAQRFIETVNADRAVGFRRRHSAL